MYRILDGLAAAFLWACYALKHPIKETVRFYDMEWRACAICGVEIKTKERNDVA
jgi:hypothetical protein